MTGYKKYLGTSLSIVMQKPLSSLPGEYYDVSDFREKIVQSACFTSYFPMPFVHYSLKNAIPNHFHFNTARRTILSRLKILFRL